MSTVEVKSGEIIEFLIREVEVVTAGVVGPQGPTGPAGAAEDLAITAGENISARKVVFLQSGEVFTASSDIISNASEALGMSVAAISVTQLVTIRSSGELTGFAGLSVDSPLYLSTDGSLTQVPPSAGVILQMGVAISSTKVLINIKQPIGLI